MATWDDVARLALALPDTSERLSRGLRQWVVKDKLFVWERPLRGSDLKALGPSAPDGPILGARVEHLGAKEAVLASDPGVFFTTPHFDGYPAVLARLDRIGAEDLEERKGLYTQATELVLEDRPLIYLYHPVNYLATTPDVVGVEYYADGLPRLKTAGFAAS